MITFISFLFLTAAAPHTWYGPIRTSFELSVGGNPYAAADNDIEVRYDSASHSETRFAYFDGKNWNATLLTRYPGTYKATVVRNGVAIRKLPGEMKVDNAHTTQFVRVAHDPPRFLVGVKPFWPMGHDLGWQDISLPSVAAQLQTMGQAGCNWSRIWCTDWDGKNFYWPPSNGKLALGWLNMGAASTWDGIVEKANSAGIRFQWVLFHHGSFATQTDPNWPDNPINVARGGWLSDPKQWFTDARCKTLAKNVIRYIVARYGHEPSVMAWELFNEVENTDAAHAGNWIEIATWHREMADYLRLIDPYHHPITTSSEMGRPIFDAVDYYQPHGYPPGVGSMVSNADVRKDKPFFFGEVGLGAGGGAAAERGAVRDSIWCALLAGHSGSAEYWYWDRMIQFKLYDEYSRASKIMAALPASPYDATPTPLRVASAQTADLNVLPGLGWAASTQTSFELPEQAAAVGKLSTFLQGTSHADMGSSVTFTFVAPRAGSFGFRTDTASRNGPNLRCTLDAALVWSKSWPSASGDKKIGEEFTIPYQAGRHTIILSNVGSDWITIQSYKFSGIGAPASGVAAKLGSQFVFRLTKAPGAPDDVKCSVNGILLPDGDYALRRWNLDDGKETDLKIGVVHGSVSMRLEPQMRDCLCALGPAR